MMGRRRAKFWTCRSSFIGEPSVLMNPHADLSGRTALVTGSTGGLGVAIAKALAANGSFVIVSGRNKSRGDAVVAGIRASGGDAAFVGADLGEGGPKPGSWPSGLPRPPVDASTSW
jgi:NAD(P)-dependent dehydrogenase (short-subunit alcohol dehydrogenase family)